MGNYVDYLHVSCHLVRFRARLTRERLAASPAFIVVDLAAAFIAAGEPPRHLHVLHFGDIEGQGASLLGEVPEALRSQPRTSEAT
jgi:hypothetical protein